MRWRRRSNGDFRTPTGAPVHTSCMHSSQATSTSVRLPLCWCSVLAFPCWLGLGCWSRRAFGLSIGVVNGHHNWHSGCCQMRVVACVGGSFTSRTLMSRTHCIPPTAFFGKRYWTRSGCHPSKSHAVLPRQPPISCHCQVQPAGQRWATLLA